MGGNSLEELLAQCDEPAAGTPDGHFRVDECLDLVNMGRVMEAIRRFTRPQGEAGADLHIPPLQMMVALNDVTAAEVARANDAGLARTLYRRSYRTSVHEECAICRWPLWVGQADDLRRRCGHPMHDECQEEWAKAVGCEKQDCPRCLVRALRQPDDPVSAQDRARNGPPDGFGQPLNR